MDMDKDMVMDIERRPEILGTKSQVLRLIEDLNSTSVDTQREAASDLRYLSKASKENCFLIDHLGAIKPLVNLLYSTDLQIQENVVTALLNLSISDNSRTTISNADAIEPLVHVLKTGSDEARENSAVTLYSLSKIEDNKMEIGRCGAIPPLVEMLKYGTPWSKKDALSALLSLSTCSKNKPLLVKAEVVKPLLELMNPCVGVADKTIGALLANLATIQEGRAAIGEAGGIRVLVEMVELGSEKAKEFAVAALCHLCVNSNRFCNMLIKEDAIPPLMTLARSGTPRAKQKVCQILRHLKIYQHNDACLGVT